MISDDFTGANATGVNLIQLGLTAKTVVNNGELPSDQGNVAVCVDTDSRYVTPDDSRKIIDQTLQKLEGWGADVICKRIDSTLRGNIGYELEALLKARNYEPTVVMMPSYPSSNRKVLGGYLIVGDQLLIETDVAKDPLKPITSSHVQTIIQDQVDLKVLTIEMDVILKGVDAVTETLKSHVANQANIIVCDALTDQHIEIVAEAMEKRKHWFIPADPGPLTKHYIKQKMLHSSESSNENHRIVATIGSATKISESQVEHLAQQSDVEVIYVQPEKLASFTSSWQYEVDRATESISNLLIENKIIVVTTNHPDFNLVDLKAKGQEENVGSDKLAKQLSNGLATITKNVIDKNSYDFNCFFSGGDITASFCEVTNSKGIKLIDEVIPLVAHGELFGNPNYEKINVITKGGMVGEPHSIDVCIRYLENFTNQRSLN